MNVNDVYSIIQYAVNKSQDGYVTEDEFNLIINQGSLSFLDWLLGQFQGYMPGRPIPKVALGNNAIVRQRLAPVIDKAILTISNQGYVDYPDDYIQADAMWAVYGHQTVRYAEQNKASSFINSTIDPVITNPIYLIEDTGFRFHPNVTNEGVAFPSAMLSYVKKPPVIHWGSIPSIYGEPVYNAATSVDPVWSDVDMLEVIARALKLVGINLQAAQVAQYAQDVIKNGQ